jgi:hypothetical protein
MDQVVAQALTLYAKINGERRSDAVARLNGHRRALAHASTPRAV